MDARDTAAYELAKRHDGVVGESELVELGFTPAAIRHRVESGMWRRVSTGVYALRPEITGMRVWLRAAVLALDDAVVSHEAAGELHHIQHVPRDRPTVTVPSAASHALGVVTVRRADDLRSSHRTTVDGFPVTTLARTIVDLGAVLRSTELERVIDTAIAARQVTHAAVRRVHEQVTRRGKPGVAILREILDARECEPAMGYSELEKRFLGLVKDANLDRPVSQVIVPWLSPWERVDFAYPDRRLVVEVDGRAFHTDAEAWERDRRRDQLAAAAGWRVLRFTWRQIVRDRARTVATLRAVLESHSRRVS